MGVRTDLSGVWEVNEDVRGESGHDNGGGENSDSMGKQSGRLREKVVEVELSSIISSQKVILTSLNQGAGLPI